MKKLLMNRRPVHGPYGGGNKFVKAICDYAPQYGYEVVHRFEPNLKAILVVDPRYDELGISVREIANYKAKFPSTKVVHRVNECDKRKGTDGVDRLLIETSKISDTSQFISEWIRDYFQEWHAPKGVIYSGAGKDIFKRSENKIENGKVNIVVSHWSDNIMKNKFTHSLDEWVGDNSDTYTFTYIGRAPKGLKNTNIIAPMWGKSFGEELGKYDVVVNSSLWDPCPNSLIESVACGLPVFVYKDGGGGVEIVQKSHGGFVYNDFEHLISMLVSHTKADYNNMSKNIDWITDWDECMKRYFEIIDE